MFKPSVLVDREQGEYPLSIPTSILLETLFMGLEPYHPEDSPPPPVPNLSNYDNHYFSIATMVRNLVNAVGVSSFDAIENSIKDVAEAILEEISVIEEVYRSMGSGCVPIFYHHRHGMVLKDNNPNLHFRRLRGKQYRVERFANMISTYVVEHSEHLMVHNQFKKNNSSILITTHYPIELLDHQRFGKMDLIESHTGVWKERYKWYTKYVYYKEDARYARLPFNKWLLYLLGDKITIQPEKKTFRKKILDMAEARSFTPNTSEAKTMLYLRKDLGLRII